MIYAFAAICLFGGALARGLNSTSPDLTFSRMENFDKTRLMGAWYVTKMGEPMDGGADCMSMDFSGVDVNMQLRTGGDSGLMTQKSRLEKSLIEEVIIATDYTSYAILGMLNSMSPRAISIITKAQHPTEDVMTLVHNVLKEKAGDVELYDVNQSNC